MNTLPLKHLFLPEEQSFVCKITLVNWIGKSGPPSPLQILASALTTAHKFQSSETLISSCSVGNILSYSCRASEKSENMQNHKWIDLTSSYIPTSCAVIENTASKPYLLGLGTRLAQMQRSLAECWSNKLRKGTGCPGTILASSE